MTIAAYKYPSSPPAVSHFQTNKKWHIVSAAALVAPVARTDEGPFAAIPEGVEAGMVVAVTTVGVIAVVAARGLVLTTKNMT